MQNQQQQHVQKPHLQRIFVGHFAQSLPWRYGQQQKAEPGTNNAWEFAVDQAKNGAMAIFKVKTLPLNST